MTKGVERVVSDAIRATLKNPREGAFMVKFAAASKHASQKHRKAADAGEHIPPFPGDEKSSGGCVLYEKRELVERIMAGETI